MTNAKHTPGPWNLEAGRSIVTSSGAFYLSYGKDRASGAPHFSNFCELDANARLIASSPRLLTALEALLQRAEALDQSATHDGLQNIEALSEARAAIEEAKGV